MRGIAHGLLDAVCETLRQQDHHQQMSPKIMEGMKICLMTPYANFASRHDLSFGAFGEYDAQTTQFFRRIFLQNHVYTVLHCACGTGRYLPLFHSLGCDVIGSDISESMLEQARKNLSAHNLQLPLIQADYRNLPRHFQQGFDAVICLASISLMPDETEVLGAFCSMRDVLRDEGPLMLTSMPTDRQWKEKPRFILSANTPDFSRLFVIDYLQDTAHYTGLY